MYPKFLINWATKQFQLGNQGFNLPQILTTKKNSLATFPKKYNLKRQDFWGFGGNDFGSLGGNDLGLGGGGEFCHITKPFATWTLSIQVSNGRVTFK